MKIYKFTAIIVLMLVGMLATSCEDEKELLVIEGDIPFKTSTLYIVGDATPAAWDVNKMYPLEQSADDKMIFIYDGNLQLGEMKAYITQGSWDTAPCIRPMTAASPISKANNVEMFQIYTGGEDLKWQIKDAGHYRLEFNFRDYTLTTTYLGV